MIGKYPNYNGDIHQTIYNIVTDLNEPDYIDVSIPNEFQSIDDVIAYFHTQLLVSNIQECETLKQIINDKKLLSQVLGKYDTIKKHIQMLYNSLPFNIKPHYDELTNALKSELLRVQRASAIFVYNNKDEIFQVLDTMKNERIAVVKDKKKEANKKYNDKQKELLGTNKDIELTEEEKLEKIEYLKNKKREANKKYNDKQKELLGLNQKIKTDVPLTDEQILERLDNLKNKKREANKKYYENQKIKLGLKQEINDDIPLTEEERLKRLAEFRAKQKEASKKHYAKTKELLGIQPRQLLTEDEKKQRRKEANKKYNESKKQSQDNIIE
jgi:hypothetical protein